MDGVTTEKGLTIMFSRLEEEEKLQLKHKRTNKVLPKPNEKREREEGRNRLCEMWLRSSKG